MKETTIHDMLKAAWKTAIADRIENALGSGLPDCNWCDGGVDFWLEYKVVGHKARSTTSLIQTSIGKVWLRPAQYSWHVRRVFFGSKVYVLARTEDQMVLLQYSIDARAWRELVVLNRPFDFDLLLRQVKRV